jgi:diguanylate cyclase (GGDEF)-like protein/PAS domain S-box-containing protein
VAPQWSVRTFLIWLVLACLLPGLIGASALFIYEYRAGRAELQKERAEAVRSLAKLVDSHVLTMQSVAQALSTSELLDKNDLAGFHERALRAVTLTGLGVYVVLRDASGRYIMSTTQPFGVALPVAPPQAVAQMRAVFSNARPSVSGIYVSPVRQRPIVTVDVPVYVAGKIVYALGLGLTPDSFNAILKAQALPPEWIATLYDGTGAIVGGNRETGQQAGTKASPTLLRAMLGASEGSLEITGRDGMPMLTLFTRCPATDWRVALSIPAPGLGIGLLRTLAALAVGVLILFGIGLALAWYMGERIAHSVRALTVPAMALGGDGPVPVPRVYITEAAEVAAAIGRVAGLLQERAAALKTKEAELLEAHRLARFGTWYWDLRTGAIPSSPSVREIFGQEMPPFEALRGTVLPVASWDLVNAASQEVVRTGKGYDLEIEVIHADGHPFWINTKCEAIRNDQGEVVALRGTLQDITERKHADARLRESEEDLRKFKFFSDNANDVHLLLDHTGRIRYANKQACERLGYSEDELLRLNVTDIEPPDYLKLFDVIFACSKEGRIPPYEETQRRKDGSTFPVEVTATVLEVNGEWLMFATSRDITERKLAEQRIREAALHDALTGLPNRSLVFEYCSHLIAATQRSHGRGALLFIDLNRFKPVNDLYGHETGDRLLQQVGARLLECTRREDLVGRLGGDEFVIVLPYAPADRHRAAIVAQHVIDCVSKPFSIGPLELSISPSIGISLFPANATDVGTLIHTADLAMYQAKQSGRGSYQFYTSELDRRADQALSIEARLKNALRKSYLTLHYQPVIDILSGRVLSAEALLRLADQDEAVGPAVFIPIAESSGLIGELGEWVLAEACRQQRVWDANGMQITVAINVSPLQFRQPGFAALLSSVIADSRVDPTCLEVEVTEGTVMESVEDAVEILQRIKSLGVRIALDDFGTGYSSLSSLSSLPIDKLKVDQSFVRRIEGDQASRAVTEAIIALGRSLRLDVVGEGIESAFTLQYLQEHGCHQAQGFWFSQPLPPAAFVAWYEARGARIPATAARPG